MFTRKQYKAIADILINELDKGSVNNEYDKGYSVGCNDTVYDIAGKLADYFAKDNPQFDRDKFLIDCGVK